MKKPNLYVRLYGTLCLAVTFLTVPVKAQVLIPATSYEDVYPSGTPTGDSPSCYSYANVNFGGNTYDTYLSAVNGTLIWRLTLPNTPSSIVNQGTIGYGGCMDMSVGYMWDFSNNLAVVAYYRPGSGHFYDVYIWTTTGLTLLSSTQVSTMASYTRISMDSHKTYGMVIVWEDATDIYCVTGLNGAFSTPILLGSTSGFQRPDVAFSHASTLDVHFVYNRPAGPFNYHIYETVADFFALHTSGGFYMPLVQDINPVTVMWSRLTCSIDAPDHYSVDNWAYTYAIDGVDIYTRSVDFNSGGIPFTQNEVNGSLGNAPMWAKELSPKLAYNQACNTFHVGWYSSFGVGTDGQCYYNVEVDESATTLISSPDYLLVAANSAYPPGAAHNSIAFSKQNDASYYLYTVFLDNAGIHHVWHPWTQTTSFRSSNAGGLSDLIHKCEEEHGVSAAKLKGELKIGPNPFSDEARLYVPLSLQKETIRIQVSDITGKVVFAHEGGTVDVQTQFRHAFKDLKAGTYFVNTEIPTKDLQQNFKVIYTGESK